jgi:hypothetical protein
VLAQGFLAAEVRFAGIRRKLVAICFAIGIDDLMVEYCQRTKSSGLNDFDYFDDFNSLRCAAFLGQA